MTKIVLEEGRTEVDGDEELLAFAGSTLVALKDGEVMAPASATLPPATTGQTTVLVDRISATGLLILIITVR